MKEIISPEFMKNKRLLPVLLLAVMMILSAVSCKQNPILFNISNEIEPKDPRIPGAASKMAAVTESLNANLNNRLYVARKYIYSYGGNSWNKIANQPGGYVVEVTASNNASDKAKTALYALTIEPYQVWKTTDGINWSTISNSTSYPTLQGIFAVDDNLFAAAAIRSSSGEENYAILWYNGSTLVSLRENMGKNGRLTGAVHVNGSHNLYYFSTINTGIFSLAPAALMAGALASSVALPGSTTSGNVTGLIADVPQDNLLAVTSSGKIITGPADGTSSFEEKANYDNVRFNGSLGIAVIESYSTDPNSVYEYDGYTMMIGYESTSDSYNFGYREIALDSTTGELPSSIYINTPGSFTTSSVAYSNKSQAEYTASLGKHIVQSIIQTPDSIDPKRTLFASTYKEGVWSYRIKEWNAEE